ncbi:hypothetical protein [Chenggangzhangella methanolivorans]|uniref:Uncharacterized protein n=1 Tax=Chenggangzhangella methanolivorans TaxID=1437009 RepID=A0A9E6R4W4_9HYPH|nr:hypothetical protein [Chenggangzhangella methanolivorans]QZN98267.1 hypothetical protein K6K41_14015 [Chenggangzhangella methanolivorans]
MQRSDATVWELARKLFKAEEDDRFWSNGLHASQLQKDGYRVLSETEKAKYYDRALDLMRSRRSWKD